MHYFIQHNDVIKVHCHSMSCDCHVVNINIRLEIIAELRRKASYFHCALVRVAIVRRARDQDAVF